MLLGVLVVTDTLPAKSDTVPIAGEYAGWGRGWIYFGLGGMEVVGGAGWGGRGGIVG